MAHASAPATAPKPPAPARHHRPARKITASTASNVFWLAAGYGVWASVTTRHEHKMTGWNVLYGCVAGIVFGLLYLALRQLTPAIPRVRRAVVWAVFWGCSIGYLHSLSHQTIYWSVILGLILGASAYLMAFYRFYTSEVPTDAHLPKPRPGGVVRPAPEHLGGKW
ncbi:hypothetical protein [Streptomyces sp. SID11385]|uniref:hypothetical protein n=1 Tax=Streptomyces sp. SID11385 TaxID=2706031 RepID=UPI001EF19F48|nr:hypothetical protein [Streptomyces sp. SID11385]